MTNERCPFGANRDPFVSLGHDRSKKGRSADLKDGHPFDHFQIKPFINRVACIWCIASLFLSYTLTRLIHLSHQAASEYVGDDLDSISETGSTKDAVCGQDYEAALADV